MKKSIIIITAILLMGCASLQNDKTYFDEDIEMIAEKIISITPVNNNILVSDFTDLDGVITHFGRYLAEKTNNYLSNNKDINLVDRNSIELILKEQKFQNSGVSRTKEAVEIGEITGADILIKGVITEFKEYVEIEISSIKITSGTIIASDFYKINKTNEVSQLIGNIVKSEEQAQIELEEYRKELMNEIEKEKGERLNELKLEEERLLHEIDKLEKELRAKSIVISEYEEKKKEALEKDAYIKQLHSEIDNLNANIVEKLKVGMSLSQVKDVLGETNINKAFYSGEYISGRYFLFFEGDILFKCVKIGSRSESGATKIDDISAARANGVNIISY